MVEVSAAPLLPSHPHWLNDQRVRVYSLLVVVITGIVASAWIVSALPSLVDRGGKPIGYDFITFWSAARLALTGAPEAVFNAAAMGAMHRLAVPALGDILFLWHYPPAYLLLVLPLGLLPYPAALVAFSGATAALWAGLIRALFRAPRAWLVAAATPAGIINFLDGQNGFLTAGLAGFALLQLDRRPRLAGMLIGLLAIKPHLAALFPVALIASRRWQTTVAAAVTAILFAAISVVVFGTPTALAFLRDLPTLSAIVDGGGLPWGQMPSPYVLMLSLHGAAVVAGLAQTAAAFGAALCVWRAWRRPGGAVEAKAAVLLAASLLVSPYLFTYDLTWGALAIAFLVIAGLRDGFAAGERDLLFSAWLAPFVLAPLYWLLGVQFGCVVCIMLLILGMRRLRRFPVTVMAVAA